MDVVELLRNYKYLAMFGVLFLCGIGLPVPEEFTLVTGGVAVGGGEATFWMTSLTCVLGILAGDSLVFALGRYYGRGLLTSRFGRWVLSRRRQAKVRKLFTRHHGKAVIVARFLSGVRIPVYAYAGQHGMSWPRFLFLDGVGALIFVPVFVGIGWIMRHTFSDADALAHQIFAKGHWVFVLLGFLVVFIVWRLIRRRREAREGDGLPGDGNDDEDADDLSLGGTKSSVSVRPARSEAVSVATAAKPTEAAAAKNTSADDL